MGEDARAGSFKRLVRNLRRSSELGWVLCNGCGRAVTKLGMRRHRVTHAARGDALPSPAFSQLFVGPAIEEGT